MKKLCRETFPLNRFFLLLVWCVCVIPSYAQYYKPLYTYYNFSFGAKALGLSNAFTAVADDLTATYWNPAGIAEFSQPQIYTNYRSDKIATSLTPQQLQSGGITQKYSSFMDSKLKNYDYFAISVPAYFWDMKWNFAISYYKLIPYQMQGQGVTSLFTQTGVTTSDTIQSTTMDISGENGIDVLGFSAAYHLSDYFALGITVQQFLNAGTVNYHYTGIQETDSYNLTYTEKFEGRNIILGLIFKPARSIVAGITYATKLSNKFNSEFVRRESDGIASNSTRCDAELPARLAFGLSIQPFEFMRISGDYSTLYYSLGKLTQYYNHSESIQYPVRDFFSFSQEDCVNRRLGTEFNIPFKKMKVFLRCGLFSDSPLFVDSTGSKLRITGYSLGLGITVGHIADLNIGYMNHKANWSEQAYFNTTQTINSHYTNKQFAMSLTIRFGNPENRENKTQY